MIFRGEGQARSGLLLGSAENRSGFAGPVFSFAHDTCIQAQQIRDDFDTVCRETRQAAQFAIRLIYA